MKKQTNEHTHRAERSWVEILCFGCTCLQLSWRRLVLRKWLNLAASESDYSADTDSESDSYPEISVWPRESRFKNQRLDRIHVDPDNGSLPRRRRRKSEMVRAQYIGTKEIRVCAATWNVAGRVPPDDINLDDWLDIDDPAHIYVIGLQEVIPLNPGNIFGAEDSRPIPKWESIIRESLSQIPPVADYKCFSDPPSPSGFQILESCCNTDEQIRPLLKSDAHKAIINRSAPSFFDGDNYLGYSEEKKVVQQVSMATEDLKLPGLVFLSDSDLESWVERKRKSWYVRIVSKQMVGVFITIWVCRSLRRYIQNLRVSTVGVGVMGYIGNKGSIAVSMSIHQTPFCFICSHLTSGEKEGDAVKRNADVLEIHRRTHFNTINGIGLPKTIYDHERIFWLGDLIYRIDLPCEQTRKLVSTKDWPKLLKRDQLKKELGKGHVFYRWHEGTLSFPPTYKYEFNSQLYHQGDPKSGRRTPAWTDRILSFGKGMKQLRYRRSEHTLSDHRPVTASYVVEVEVVSNRKLRRALDYTDVEVEEDEVGIAGGTKW